MKKRDTKRAVSVINAYTMDMIEYCDAIIDWGHVVAVIERERKNKEISKYARQREVLRKVLGPNRK